MKMGESLGKYPGARSWEPPGLGGAWVLSTAKYHIKGFEVMQWPFELGFQKFLSGERLDRC